MQRSSKRVRFPESPARSTSGRCEQHDVLRSTLEYFGVEAISFESHGGDAVRVVAADAAVALRDGVVLMRPTAMSRRAEADRMQAEFARIDVPIAGHIARRPACSTATT